MKSILFLPEKNYESSCIGGGTGEKVALAERQSLLLYISLYENIFSIYAYHGTIYGTNKAQKKRISRGKSK